jgi:hypothetical protein
MKKRPSKPCQPAAGNVPEGQAADGFDLPPVGAEAVRPESQEVRDAQPQEAVDADIFHPVPSDIADKHRPTKRRHITRASEPLKLGAASAVDLAEPTRLIAVTGFQALVEASRLELRRQWGQGMTGEQRDLLDVLAGSKAAAMLFDSLVHRLGDNPSEADILVCRVLATRLTIGNLYQLQVRRFHEAGRRRTGPEEPQPWRVE